MDDLATTPPETGHQDIYLSEFCEFLRNETFAGANATFVATEEPEYDEEASLLDFLFVNSNSSNETWQFNKTEMVMRLETTSEVGIIPVMAGIGIFLNLLLSVLLKKDPKLRRVSYGIIQILIICEVFFLSFVLSFVAFHQSDYRYDVDVMSYVTCVMSLCQFYMHWMFLFMQREVYRSVKGTWYPDKLQTCRRHTRNIVLLILTGLAIHAPFIPYIRIQIYKLHHIFNPCTIPLNDLWDLSTTIRKTSDWYYVLYFFIFYFIVIYALPFFLVGCTDKDIIDLLFLLKNKTKLHPVTIEAAHTAMAVSVLSNVFLVCLTTKSIVIGFRIVNFFCLVFKGAHPHVFFFFMNVFGNLSIVARPTFNLFVFVVYTTRYRHRVWVAIRRFLEARRCRNRIRKPC